MREKGKPFSLFFEKKMVPCSLLFTLATVLVSSISAQVAPRATDSRVYADVSSSKDGAKQDVLHFVPCSERKLFTYKRVTHRRPHPVNACFTARLPENIANNCIPDVALSLDGRIMGADVFRVSDYVDVHFQLEFPCASCELEIKVDCLSGDDESAVQGRFKTIFTTVWLETVSVKPTFYNHAASLAIVQAEKESNETLTEEEKLEIKKELIQTSVTKWPCTEEKVECDENGVPTHELPEDLKDKIEYAEYMEGMIETNKTVTPFHSVPDYIRNRLSSY